ncbi:lipoprotein insertase outer membrane protein LolB [Shewanella algae]
MLVFCQSPRIIGGQYSEQQMIILKYFTKNCFIRLSALRLLLPLLLGLLSACSSLPDARWQATQVKHANQAKAWELKGKLAVKTPEEKFSTNLYWLHTPTTEELRLTTMLGTSVMLLKSGPDGAFLELDGEVYRDRDPQRLLDGLSNWSIPLNALPRWVLGLSAADTELLLTNNDGKPQSLEDGSVSPPWQVKYLSWQQQSGADIPRLLKLNRGALELKIQLTEWQALEAEPKLTTKESQQP